MALISIVYFMLGIMINLRFGINSSAISLINVGLSVFATLAIIWFLSIVLALTIKYSTEMNNETY